MNWTETSPGKFRAELDGVEKIYRAVSQSFKALDREHWGLYCACTVEHGPDVSAALDLGACLRRSWVLLRREFPGLAVMPDGLTHKTYQLPDAESVAIWAEETFVSVPLTDEADLESILASYQLKERPTLFWLPRTSQVVLTTSHWRIDALGTCMLLDRLFAIAAELTSSSPGILEDNVYTPDLQHISPSLEDAVGSPPISTPESEEFARAYIDAHHRQALHAGGIPHSGNSDTVPGRPSLFQISLTTDSTAALVRACKARQISVTSAVQSALAEVVFALSPMPADTYTAVVSANMRPYLPVPYNGPEHAVQVYVTGLTPSVKRRDSFVDKAKGLTAFYKGESWRGRDFVTALRPIMREHLGRMFPPPAPAKDAGEDPEEETEAKPKPRTKPLPSNVTLSSLGVIERRLAGEYGPGLRVTDFTFGVSIMTAQMLLYVWTYRGQTSLSVNYNDAYHGPVAAQGLIRFVMGVLETGLGVKLSASGEKGVV